jgi:hypothetical protein
VKHDQHNVQIGRLVGNLGSLEFALRLFLAEAAGQEVALPKSGEATVRLSYVTNWDSLGDLVRKYDQSLSADEGKAFRVDDEAVALRDAIAHGRVLSATPDPPLTLYRFGKPKDNMVPVEWCTVLDAAWLRGKVGFVHRQIMNVVECARARGYKSFPND